MPIKSSDRTAESEACPSTLYRDPYPCHRQVAELKISFKDANGVSRCDLRNPIAKIQNSCGKMSERPGSSVTGEIRLSWLLLLNDPILVC